MSDETQAHSLAATENYAAWLSVEPDGETVYHLELGAVTAHFFPEEWGELLRLIQSGRIESEDAQVIDRYVVWGSRDADGDPLYGLELGDATIYFGEDEWAEVAEMLLEAARKTGNPRR